MMLSIHQPSYFPWLGLLDKIAKTDVFILLDDVQVSKGTYQIRNIFYCNGESKYITLPVNYRLGCTFTELEFKNNTWPDQHLNQLRNYYRKAPYFDEVFADLENFFKECLSFNPVEVLIESILFCFKGLKIKNELIRSSTLNYTGTKGEMVLNICKAIKAKSYLAGRGSYEYMRSLVPVFEESGITLRWHSFNHPIYKQVTKYKFIEGLSTLDLFFFMGYQNSNEIFWNNINS